MISNKLDRLIDMITVEDTIKKDLKILAVDFDKTISTFEKWEGPTVFGKPIQKMINIVNKMYDSGVIIHIFTCRKDSPELRQWLNTNGVKYHDINTLKYNYQEMSMKPLYDVILDDKAVSPFDPDCENKIMKMIFKIENNRIPLVEDTASAVIPDHNMVNPDVCPICNGIAVARCRCKIGHRTCTNKHSWYILNGEYMIGDGHANPGIPLNVYLGSSTSSILDRDSIEPMIDDLQSEGVFDFFRKKKVDKKSELSEESKEYYKNIENMMGEVIAWFIKNNYNNKYFHENDCYWDFGQGGYFWVKLIPTSDNYPEEEDSPQYKKMIETYDKFYNSVINYIKKEYKDIVEKYKLDFLVSDVNNGNERLYIGIKTELDKI